MGKDGGDTSDARTLIISAAVLVVAVLGVFGQTGAFDFVNFDDPDYVTNNPAVRAGLSWAGVRWAFGEFHAGHWHPLTWLSHMLDVSLFGLDAGRHHLVSVGIHAVNGVLLLVLLRRLGLGAGTALFVAAAFALHPLRAESVAWVTGRKDMLSMFFLLLAVHAYVSYARLREWNAVSVFGIVLMLPGKVLRRATVLAAFVCFALGLMCKPLVITLPALLLLLDVWPLERATFAERRGWMRLVVEKLPLFALSFVSAVVTVSSQRAAGAVVETAPLDLVERLSNAVVSTVSYLGLLLAPVRLAAFYPLVPRPWPAVVGAIAVVVAVSALARRWRRERPWLLMGWLWFLVALSPVIGVVQVGGQAMADRYALIPSLGFFLIVAEGGRELISSRTLRAGLATLSVVGLAALALVQTSKWCDSETLWRHALEVEPENFMAHTNLGVVLSARGDEEGATEHFEEAVRLNPTWPVALNNLGNAHARAGRLDDAVALYRRALAREPDNVPARYNLGLALVYLGRSDEARVELEAVLERDQSYAPARETLEHLDRRGR